MKRSSTAVIFCYFIPEPIYVRVTTRVTAGSCSSPPLSLPKGQVPASGNEPRAPKIMQFSTHPSRILHRNAVGQTDKNHAIMSAITQLAEPQPSACGPSVFKASRKTAQAVNIPGNPGGCSQALNPCKTK